MTKNKPAALMSYAHSDDTDRHLTTFRERLSQEVHVQTGRDFPIFQDTKDIQWGQSWQQRINDSLDEVTFLIPIMTPSFFHSEPCRAELERFIEREKRLGRNDLILPVYFVETDLLSDPELRATDELAEVIASRQYIDWRDLRFEQFTNPQVRKILVKLAVQIRDALPRLQAPPKAGQTTSALDTQPTAATTRQSGEQTTEGPTLKKEPPSCVVDSFHRGDFTTITDAIKAVEPGTRILVRPGQYRESLVIDKPLEIIGDGESGDVVIQAADMHVIRFQTTMGRLVNLTLRQIGGKEAYCVDIGQGRLEIEDCDITSQNLACVGIHGGADPRLRRNRIHDSKGGSGVHLYEKAEGTLEDNDIFGNALSGVAISDGAIPTLRRNRIHDGQVGVMVRDAGQGTIEDNDIFDNSLSGVEIKKTGNPALRRNRIYNNRQSGMYVHDGGQGTLEDTDLFNNGYSGIESRSGGKPTVRNNRINRNAYYGFRVYENGGGTFENNDLTENTKGTSFITDDSQGNVRLINNKEK